MHMVAPAKVWTVEEVLALPYEGRRYELIDGILLVNGVPVPRGDLGAVDPAMTPSPSFPHQGAVTALWRLLTEYLESHRTGCAFVAPADIVLGNRRVVQPDVFVVPLVDGRAPRTWDEAGSLLLAVEVVSPSTARTDRVIKRRVYQEAGVPVYWLVDLDARIIQRWRSGAARSDELADVIEWLAPGAPEPLRIDIPAFFTRVHGTPAIG